MQLSIIRPNTSFLVTCLADKTNHPVRSPHQPIMHHQKICHAPPLTVFISISTSHAPPTKSTHAVSIPPRTIMHHHPNSLHLGQTKSFHSIRQALAVLSLLVLWCQESKRLHLDKTLASFSTLGRARLCHLASFLNIAIIKTCFI